MKKFTLIFYASILLCFSCEKLMAQAPYKASVGGMISYLPVVGGFSLKTFITKEFSFQTDIYFKTMLTGGIHEGYAIYSSCVINPNFMYQNKMKELKQSELFWFLGSGVSFGFTMKGCVKFGANAIMGIEYIFFNTPLSIQIDMRPGYGMLFSFSNEFNNLFLSNDKNPWHHFDLMIGFSIRYTFKNKICN